MSAGHVLVIIVVVTIFQSMVSEAKLAEVLARARITKSEPKTGNFPCRFHERAYGV